MLQLLKKLKTKLGKSRKISKDVLYQLVNANWEIAKNQLLVSCHMLKTSIDIVGKVNST